MHQTDTQSSGSSRSDLLVVYLFLVFTCLIYVVASFLPGKRLWGCNHLAYYPLAWRIVALALMVMSLTPWVRRAVYSRFASCVEWFRGRRARATAVSIGISLAAIVLFYGLRSATLLLGDGDVVAGTMTVTYVGGTDGMAHTLWKILTGTPTAPGTTALFYLMGVAGSGVAEPVVMIRLLNCLLGGIFVFVVLKAAAANRVNEMVAGWLVLLAFASGAMELFFGYVENYALLFVLGTLYVITGFRVLHGQGSLWGPIVLFLLAAFAHASGVLLGTSLVFLIAFRIFGAVRRRVLRNLAFALAAWTAIVVFFVARYTSLGDFFLPLVAGKGAVLSVGHLADVANEVLLLVPVFPVVVGFAIVSLRSPRRGTAVETSQALQGEETNDGGLTPEIESYFVLLVFFTTAVYLLFFNPVIGLGRDWDLASVFLLGLAPLCLVIIERSRRTLDAARHAFGPSVVIGTVMVSAWIGVNASTEMSTRRFEDIVGYQENRRDYAYEILAKTYYQNGRLSDAIRTQEKAIAISHNVRLELALVHYYREYGDVPTSVSLLQKIVEGRPSYRPARRELIVARYNHRRFDDAIALAETGVEYDPDDPFYYYYIGKSLVRMNRIDEGREALLEAQNLAPGPLLSKDIVRELSALPDKYDR